MDAVLDVALSMKKMMGGKKSESDLLKKAGSSASQDPHAPDSLANASKILEIQDYFIDGVDLSSPGRLFVREGTLVKMCRKAPKARYFVLFNDSLLYGTIIKDKTAQRHVVCAKPVLLPLGSMTITPLSDERTSEDSEYEHGFQISTPSKSFQVFASTEVERAAWLDSLSTYALCTTENPEFAAAVWIPDYKVANCMLCEFTRFTTFSRRHHCRKCGKVVCGSCSTQRRPLAASSAPVRVCDICAGLPVRKQDLSLGKAPAGIGSNSNDPASDSDDSGDDEGTASEVTGANGRVAFAVQPNAFPVPAPKPVRFNAGGEAAAAAPAPADGAVAVAGNVVPRRRQFKKSGGDADGAEQSTPVEPAPVANEPEPEPVSPAPVEVAEEGVTVVQGTGRRRRQFKSAEAKADDEA